MTSPRLKLQTSIGHLDNQTDPLGIPAARSKPWLASTQKPTRKLVEKSYTYLGTFSTIRYTENTQSITFNLLQGQSLRIPYQAEILTMLDLRPNHFPAFQISSTTRPAQKGKNTLEIQDVTHIRVT